MTDDARRNQALITDSYCKITANKLDAVWIRGAIFRE
jgi:hypothetical protein